MMIRATLLLISVVTGFLPAQGITPNDLSGQNRLSPFELERELVRMRRRLQVVVVDRERMVDQLIRHNLGRDITGDPAFMTTGALNRKEEKAQNKKLRELETSLISLRRAWRLIEESAVDAVLVPLPSDPDPQEWSPVPGPEDLPGFSPESNKQRGEATPAPGDVAVRKPVQAPVPEDLSLEEPRYLAVLSGSSDHVAVARLLFLAGRNFIDRGVEYERAERTETAALLRARARKKFELVLEELGRVVIEEDASYEALFHQGKALESLFLLDIHEKILDLENDPRAYRKRLEEVRRPFLRITSRDLRRAGGAERLGTWGKAADTAMDQILWLVRQQEERLPEPLPLPERK